MTGAIEFRPAEPSDIPQLVALMNSQYARKKKGAYFQWQFFESAYPTIMMCAFLDNVLLGMFGLQKRVTANGVRFGQAIDLLVSPELRGQGVFKELGMRAARCFPELDALCVLPNLNGKNACVKSLGWDAIAKIDSLCFNASRLPGDYTLLPDDPENGILANFDYTTEIRHWRYDIHPDYQYETVVLEKGVFAVTKLFQEPLSGKRYGDIVDFCCDLGDSKSLADLFILAVRHLRAKGIESVTTWALPHTHLFKVLTGIGFESISQERYFCVKALKPDCEYIHMIENWHLVQADAEIY